jgi:hypothetical protein
MNLAQESNVACPDSGARCSNKWSGVVKRPLFALIASTVALGACTATRAPLEVPMDVVATASNPRYTGWAFDYCEGEESTDPATACVSHGGEIYKARLSDVRTGDGKRIASTLTIGLPGHALARDFRARIQVWLVRAADDFRKDTGIEYVATHWQWLPQGPTSHVSGSVQDEAPH